MKTIIVIIIVIILIAIGGYFLTRDSVENGEVTPNPSETTTPTPTLEATTTPETTNQNRPVSVIGKSAGGHDITAYHYGQGETELLFVGGIHGGYSWNTVLVAQELREYLAENPTIVPANLKVTVIPVLNPDGLNKVVGMSTGDFTVANVSASSEIVVSGRFNSNNVDLNRNFDCDWQTSGKWQNKTVSGGTAAFSELESQAIKNYVEANKPAAVVIWYSAAGGVYASSCHNGVSAETKVLMDTYAKASDYPAHDSYDFYETTGDMANWLAKNNIPAISVLLTNHQNVEWDKNRAGIEALFNYYAE